MLSEELEDTLRRALAIAGDHAHEFATLEHLLLAMTEDPDALSVLTGCKVDVEQLREMLQTHIDDEFATIALRELVPVFKKYLKQDGSLLISGLLSIDIDLFTHQVIRDEFTIRKKNELGEWSALWLKPVVY